jgi:hypothetical protein
MFATQVTDGLLGSFAFNENGDPVATGETDVVAFTIYNGQEELEVETTLSPAQENVDAARGL